MSVVISYDVRAVGTAVNADPANVLHLGKDANRVQAHKMGSRVVLFSRNGHDFTERFASIAELLREMPAKAAILEHFKLLSGEAGTNGLRHRA